MRIITSASYFGTGASAVVDYVAEFSTVNSMGKYEYRFIQDPDGIADLEYNIVENNHRHNTSHAIKRYLKMVNHFNNFGYGGGYKDIKKEFRAATERYIEAITDLKAKSWWHRDRVDKGTVFALGDRMYSFIMRLTHGGLKTEKKYSILRKTEYGYYSAIDENEFLSATKRYIDEFASAGNKGNKPFVMIEQMVQPTNVNRYVRYFNDVKVVVIERDPRDVYLNEKTKYQWGVIPTASVEEYVKWFKITRKYSHPQFEDREHVLRLQFEDMIFKYEDTSRILRDFIGLNEKDHVNKFAKFNPAKSEANTNLKHKIRGYEKEIEYIENNLREYLYDFEAAMK